MGVARELVVAWCLVVGFISKPEGPPRQPRAPGLGAPLRPCASGPADPVTRAPVTRRAGGRGPGAGRRGVGGPAMILSCPSFSHATRVSFTIFFLFFTKGICSFSRDCSLAAGACSLGHEILRSLLLLANVLGRCRWSLYSQKN